MNHLPAHFTLRARLISGVFLGFVFLLLVALVFYYTDYQFFWSIVWEQREHLLSGFWMTLGVSLFAFVGSLCFGVFLLMLRRSRILPLEQAATALGILLRGTPLLTQVLVWYYVVFALVGFNNGFWAGVVILSIFGGSNTAEVLRGGIESVPNTQREAAFSLGFSKFDTYLYIIIPEVMGYTLPALTSQLASLVKDSSLLSVMAVVELTRASQEVAAYSYTTIEVYIFMAIGYLILTSPIFLLSRYLERHFRY